MTMETESWRERNERFITTEVAQNVYQIRSGKNIRKIAEEQMKPEPDQDVLKKLYDEMQEIIEEGNKLDSMDMEYKKYYIKTYGGKDALR